MAGTPIRVAFAQLCVFSEELKVSHPEISEDIPSWEQSAQLDSLAEVSSSQFLTECALYLGDNPEQDPLETGGGKNTVTQPDFLSWLFPPQR